MSEWRLIQVDGGEWDGHWGVDRLRQVAGSPRGRPGNPQQPAANRVKRPYQDQGAWAGPVRQCLALQVHPSLPVFHAMLRCLSLMLCYAPCPSCCAGCLLCCVPCSSCSVVTHVLHAVLWFVSFTMCRDPCPCMLCCAPCPACCALCPWSGRGVSSNSNRTIIWLERVRSQEKASQCTYKQARNKCVGK